MRRTGPLARLELSMILAVAACGPCSPAIAAERTGGDEPTVIQLTIRPNAPARPAPSLLPPDKDRKDGNGAEHYADAAEAISKLSGEPLTGTWIMGTVANLAREEAADILSKAKPALATLDKAARCRECNWDAPPSMDRLSDYRNLARYLSLQVRLAIAGKRYDDAIHGVQTGLALARDLSQGTELLHSLVSVAIGELILRQVDELVGSSGAPNLHPALAGLPSPLVDLEDAIQRDLARLKNENPLVQPTLRATLQKSHVRARFLAMRLDRHIAALRTVELIRWHAAAHDGKLPKTLKEMKEAQVPNDPATSQPFEYQATAANRATLTGPPPKDGSPSEGLRYELNLGRE